ncbi:MAG: thioredoxin family protein [Roseibacillus sp.]|nr:thioredoxin family protein [Roseibacillus sp.]
MKLLKRTMTGLAMGALVMNAQAADKVELEGAKVGVWTMDYDAAVKLAGEKKLPLMLNFTGSDWCGWCKLMDEKVFAEEVWKAYAKENVLLVTLDFPRDKSIVPEKYVERNEKLQEQFGVRGFPTYVVLDNDGKTKLGQLGAGRDKTPSTFIDEFKGVALMSAGSIEAFLKANPDKAEAYKAAIAELRDAEKKLEVAKKPLNDWLKTRPKRTEENTKKFEGFNKSIGEAQKGVTEAEVAVREFH